MSQNNEYGVIRISKCMVVTQSSITNYHGGLCMQSVTVSNVVSM